MIATEKTGGPWSIPLSKMYEKYSILLCAGSLLILGLASTQSVAVEKIAVGAIFDQNTEEIQNVFKYAMTQQNQNISSRGRLELQAYVDVINTADAFKLSRLICNQFARGVWSMLGAVTPDSFDTLHSYTNTFQMPFVTPWFPEKVIPPSSGIIDHAVSLRPDYHKAIIDTILHYGWRDVIYVYDSHDGLLRLQQIYQLMQPGRTTFRISVVKRIYNVTDAMEFLLALEQHDRWGSKRIVLDCSAKNAKSIVISHVQNLQLGRRTYHYILSGLVMDDHWEKEVTEYGAVNITGFRVVDHSRKIVRDFMDGLRRMDPRYKDTITAQAALMYDGVQVVIDALGRLWRKKPDVFRNAMRRAAGQNSTKFIDCNPGKNWVVPFEHGEKIYRLIKKTDIEGLTGYISFDEDGHRHNFTLQIVEMSVQYVMVKIATWSDKYGLVLSHPKYNPQNSPGSLNSNKTFVVSTILQEPFMMHKPSEKGPIKNEQFYGLCKDLLDYFTSELGIKYELRIVKDGYYGNPGPNGWNGLIGELVRKEADIAIAPLVVTADREKVVDLSEPYFTFNYPLTDDKKHGIFSDTFSFLRPLSKEIWLCIIFSFFAVSIVLFLVSRFSPHEWRSVSISDTHLDQPVSSTNEIILHNDFSIWTSIWFSLGSFLQQGSDVVPRSLSGRIVSTVWWFFALILVCSYTANLAAYLIVERISIPLSSEMKPTGDTESTVQNNGRDVTFQLKSEAINELAISLTTLRVILKNNLVTPQAVSNSNGQSALYTVDNEGRYICNSATTNCRPKYVDFAIASTKDTTLREAINLSLVNMKNSGLLQKLLRKWLTKNEETECLLPKKEEKTITEMTLSQVAGIFYVLIGGLALALGVAFLEFCQHGRIEAARANVPLHAALRAKAKLATRTERKPPQRTPQRDRERLGWNGTPFAGYYAGANQISQEEALQASFTHV